MQRIHIVGCGPRSGTTLLSEMMTSCFEIDAFAPGEQRIFTRPPRGARIFLTKAPRDVVVIGRVLRLMRNLHVLCMLRDPRDMIVSRHGEDPERFWSGLGFWKAYTPYVRRLLDHPRFFVVRYERLVTHPDEVQDELTRRMPFLGTRAPFSRFHETSRPAEPSRKALGGVRPVSDASIGRWRRHLSRVAGQLRIHGPITPDLVEFGYEPDGSWEALLDGVEPDLRPSHWPEEISRDTLRRLRRGSLIRAVALALRHPGGSAA